MTFVINGPINGNGFIFGNSSGDDIINAFANMNMVLSQGANDTINLLGNSDIVNLGTFTGVSDTVNVTGGMNTIDGTLTTSFVNVNGGTGNNTVDLANTGGVTSVSLSGFFNHITVNAGSTNSIVSGAGNATIAVGASPAADDDVGQGWSTSIILGGMSNKVTGDDQNTTINGGQGFDTIWLADGNNTITEAGVGNSITVGSGTNTIVAGSGSDTVTITQGDLGDDVVVVPTDKVTIAGTANKVTAGDENVNVFGGTGFATITMGNGNDNVMTSGSANHVTLGNGNDIVNIAASSTAGGNTVTLGNGNDTVNVDGANNHITVGNGADSVTALGGGNVIHAGTGVGPAGPDTITVGDNSMVFGTGLKAGSVIDSIGSHNDVSLSNNSSGTIKDEPTGNSLFAELTGIGLGGTYTGKVTITGFGNDLATGRIDFDNVRGGVNGALLTSAANVFANSTSDGMGGTLIKLAGGGNVDLANSSFSGSTFV